MGMRVAEEDDEIPELVYIVSLELDFYFFVHFNTIKSRESSWEFCFTFGARDEGSFAFLRLPGIRFNGQYKNIYACLCAVILYYYK